MSDFIIISVSSDQDFNLNFNSINNNDNNKSALLDREIEETGGGLQKSYTEFLRSIAKDNAAMKS